MFKQILMDMYTKVTSGNLSQMMHCNISQQKIPINHWYCHRHHLDRYHSVLGLLNVSANGNQSCNRQHTCKNAKYFQTEPQSPSNADLHFVSSTFSQTPAYTAKLWTRATELAHYTACLLMPQFSPVISAPNQHKKPAVARIADLTGCQWPWTSSKVDDFNHIWKSVWPPRPSKTDDFHLIWKSVCHFLLVNLGPISHGFRHMAIYNLKLSTENCGQTAADGDMVTIDSL